MVCRSVLSTSPDLTCIINNKKLILYLIEVIEKCLFSLLRDPTHRESIGTINLLITS